MTTTWGTPVMEVFKMVYLGPDKVMPEKQHGTAKLSFDGAEQYLYNVVEVDPRQPAIQYMDDIVVQYRAPPVNFKELNILFDLFDGAYKCSIYSDWDPPQQNYNTFYDDRIRSEDGLGEISVLYGLFSNGTVASIEVKLLNDSVVGADVYGVVAASNSDLPSPSCMSLLYMKGPDNKTKVGDGGLIPLIRSCVGVPMDSKLYVYISLHLDDAEYKTRLEFDALTAGKETLEFDSTCGNKSKIQVTVAWYVDHETIDLL